MLLPALARDIISYFYNRLDIYFKLQNRIDLSPSPFFTRIIRRHSGVLISTALGWQTPEIINFLILKIYILPNDTLYYKIRDYIFLI